MLHTLLVRCLEKHGDYEECQDSAEHFEQAAHYEKDEFDLELFLRNFVDYLVVLIVSLSWNDKNPVHREGDETQYHESHQILPRVQEHVIPHHLLDLAY